MTERKSLREMAIEASGESRGVECPRCGCRDFRVDKTMRLATSTHRWKSCRHCGFGVVTSTVEKERIIREVSRHNQHEDDYKDPDTLVLRLA